MPKRTGRKRKRGSSDKFEFDDTIPHDKSSGDQISYKITALDLLRMFKNNSDNTSICLLGSVQETHRFRGSVTILIKFGYGAYCYIRYS